MGRYGASEDRRGMEPEMFHIDDISLSVNGLRKPDRLLFWLFDEAFFYTSEENLQPRRLEGVTLPFTAPAEAGHYRVEFWDTAAGEVMETRDLEVPEGGAVMELELPPFQKSIALKLIRQP